MGAFDTYCCFCSGPLDDARVSWLNVLLEDMRGSDKWPPEDGEWANSPGYPVPTKPIDEIMTLSVEEGKTWEDWVVVSPVFADTYVSPPAAVGSYGDVEIDGDDNWNPDEKEFLHIHRICLSFLCRRNNITPKDLWNSSFGPNASYGKNAHSANGLFYCVDYYDMTERNGQSFGYAVEKWDPPEDRPTEGLESGSWWDPETMEDTKWLLARPTELPKPEPLAPTTIKPSSLKKRKVFDISELLDLILDYVVDVPEDVIAKELKANGIEEDEAVADDDEDTDSEEDAGEVDEDAGQDDDAEDGEDNEDAAKGEEEGDDEEDDGNEDEDDGEDDEDDGEGDEDGDEDDEVICEAPSAWIAVETLFSLMQVDRLFYHSIRSRQVLFLQAMRNFGWMLPTTPADYAHSVWPEKLATEGPLSRQTQLDWRAYMIEFMRKENPHIRNRWRFHTMAVQFARGTDNYSHEEDPEWFWNAGNLGVKTSLVKPESFEWEVPPPEDKTDTVEYPVERQFRELTTKA